MNIAQAYADLSSLFTAGSFRFAPVFQNQPLQTLLNYSTSFQKKRMKRFMSIALLALLAGVFQACHGNNAGATDAVTSDTSTITGDTVKHKASAAGNTPDAVFAREATIDGMAELAMTKLALTKAVDIKIKDFADQVAVDDTRATGELKNLLKTKSLPLPGVLDGPRRQTIDSLGKLPTAQFDKAYMTVIIDEHKKTFSLMQNEAKNGQDSDLKAFAARTAPMEQTQLDSIAKIQQSIK